jgi:hypothetical protein
VKKRCKKTIKVLKFLKFANKKTNNLGDNGALLRRCNTLGFLKTIERHSKNKQESEKPEFTKRCPNLYAHGQTLNARVTTKK